MLKYRLIAILVLLVGLGIGYLDVAHIYTPDFFLARSFKLGLDLQGGVHLIYKADISNIALEEISEAMDGLRDVIERRVNFFGVAEPIVQLEESGSILSSKEKEQRLIVELPGVTDVNQAIAMIGETPFLEFRTERPDIQEGMNVLEAYQTTSLNGRYLKKAVLQFNQTTYEPQISIEFNDEGANLFAQMTKDNVNKTIAIFLDGAPISMPVVREEIPNGKAQISGQFTPEEAKQLVQRLNSGALPVPIHLISQQNIGPTLGEKILDQGIKAGILGLILVSLFLIIWYRLPGLVAVLALALYTIIVLAIFKLIPVTLTAAGIAGFILSVGMAVDANILIFERMKEERKQGRPILSAITEGFHRAWLSIRDSNFSSLITAVILFWMGTSMVKGFALTLGIGVLVSMFSAITISRTFLLSLKMKEDSKIWEFLFGSGIN